MWSNAYANVIDMARLRNDAVWSAAMLFTVCEVEKLYLLNLSYQIFIWRP